MFEKIKKWYPDAWNKSKVRNAVEKKVITPEQYQEITGEPYEGDD